VGAPGQGIVAARGFQRPSSPPKIRFQDGKLLRATVASSWPKGGAIEWIIERLPD